MAVELENIRKLLEGERERLTEKLASKTGHGADEAHEGSPFGKREESADECVELEKRLACIKRIGEQLLEVQLALQKLENGTYGLCDGCGSPIPIARLEALPQTAFCLECKVRKRG